MNEPSTLANLEGLSIPPETLRKEDWLNCLAEGIDELPVEMYGKIMSIPDELVWTYLEVFTDVPDADLLEMKIEVQESRLNPSDNTLYNNAASISRPNATAVRHRA